MIKCHAIATTTAFVCLAFSTSFAEAAGAQIPQAWVVQAADSGSSSQAKKPKKEKKAKAKKGGGVSFYEGSGETRAERDKRLTRECKGRTNAGLCEGYARP
jgi:Mor family transcriptional regulator